MNDLEYHVEATGVKSDIKIYSTFYQAKAHAVFLLHAFRYNVPIVCIDVVTWTRAAARQYGGDEAAAIYDEDPDASVHDRIKCTLDSKGNLVTESLGRVP